MFRDLTRKKQLLSPEECIEILKTQTRGVLSVNGDNGYPYAMPMNHFYNEADGCVYFHTGRYGHRTDALKKDGRVCLCVYDRGYRKEGEWALNIRSVIAFGRAEIISEYENVVDICRNLSLKYTSDTAYIEEEVYHEHFGLYHKPGYRETQKGRLADYHAADILMGRDLFVTMDGPNEDLDVAAIDRFIINTILPLCTGTDDSGIENDF